jgi:CO/xanthine dehydrogenase FAD-binding subunit
VAPRSLAEAVRLLAENPGLVPIAGCTDVMVREPEALADLPGVLDLLAVPELRGIREGDGEVEIGAATTFAELRVAPLVRRRFPALADAASQVGGWQIQNRATIGGNVVNASPAGDSLPVLLALGARVVVAGAGGERTVPYDVFHTGYRETALGPGELVNALVLPAPVAGSRQLFRKVGTRAAQAISKVVVAMLARLESGRLVSVRLGAGSVGATPVRLRAVEEALFGRAPDAATAELAGRLAAKSVEPIDDVRSTASYRRFALANVVRRMVLQLGEKGAG